MWSHLADKSCTYIKLFIKIYLLNCIKLCLDFLPSFLYRKDGLLLYRQDGFLLYRENGSLSNKEGLVKADLTF